MSKESSHRGDTTENTYTDLGAHTREAFEISEKSRKLARKVIGNQTVEDRVRQRCSVAVGDFAMADLLAFRLDPVNAGISALERGAPLICDIRMVQVGIQKKGHRSEVLCALDYGSDLAIKEGITRTSAGFRTMQDRLDGSVIVIGNAPSALLSVCEMIGQGIVPALVVGTPVGFVNAAESKEELMKLPVPSISNTGTRGRYPCCSCGDKRDHYYLLRNFKGKRAIMRSRDPVTGFVYPDEWVSACRDPDALGLARTGRAVLTSSGRVLMRGFTTGTTAAAACKAAILSLKGEINSVRVTVPAGLTIDVPVSGRDGRAVCHKYAGDYPGDVTAGIGFVAEYQPCDGGISLVAGEGIGRFSRTTPRYAKDEPAISPPARDCILRSVEEAVEQAGLDGARIFLSVPDGECIAEKTLNPVIGITGGISVLGTTGLVEPWDDHMCEAVMERVSGSERMVLTTGRIGMQYSRMLFPDHDVILVGGKIKEALSHASGEVVLCGLPGLVLRYADPGILDGTGYVTVEELCTDPSFGDRLTRAVSLFHTRHPGVRVVIFDRTGTVLGDFQ